MHLLVATYLASCRGSIIFEEAKRGLKSSGLDLDLNLQFNLNYLKPTQELCEAYPKKRT